MVHKNFASSEHLNDSYALQPTPSALAIKIFFGLLQYGFDKFWQFNEKHEIATKYLDFCDHFLK